MNRERRAAVLTGFLLAGLTFAPDPASASGRRLAMWVWTDEISDVVRRDALLDRAAQSCVETLYVSVYRSTPNADGDRLPERALLGALLARAHALGIEVRVWTAYGDPSWPSLCVNADSTCSCKPACWVWDRIDEYNQFNADPRYEDFDGWIFDVEPASADGRLLGLYDCARQRLAPGAPMGAAIRFFWHDPVDYPCGSGQVAPFYEHVIGTLDLDLVVVMCYRDFAEGADGIIDLCEEEAGYAAEVGRTDRLQVGVETAPASPEKVTFIEEGAAAMTCALSAVERALPVGGFAVNYYEHAMLGGSALWPGVDPWACEARALTATHDDGTGRTTLSWPAGRSGLSYDVIRGDLAALRESGGAVDLGAVAPIAASTEDTSVVDLCPSDGRAHFYLHRVRTRDAVGTYGESSRCTPRLPVQELTCP